MLFKALALDLWAFDAIKIGVKTALFALVEKQLPLHALSNQPCN